MRVWTIQTLDAWELAKHHGYIVGNPKYIYPKFISSYKWMMKQMHLRLKHYKGEYPVWFWTKRPDLRQTSYLDRGKIGVLLEVELMKEDILLSDYEAWHIVLYDSFLSINAVEEEEYLLGNYSLSKEESWERIFDFNSLYMKQNWVSNNNIIQGVTGAININQVKSLKRFIAR